ncbi:MAG: leucyl/phenylalanyl-tRNA--protein transferase [Phycisphaerales bacterium]|nr:leucyl/phenylalanyl-tRNA--protein transferase [Phycisphaerales bacterium]
MEHTAEPDPREGGPEARRSAPPLTQAEHDLASNLLRLYQGGAFPMADPETGEVGIFRTHRRAVIPVLLEGDPPSATIPGHHPVAGRTLHIPKRLARTVRSGKFHVTRDAAFPSVVAGCAAPRVPRMGSESVSADTWIDEELAACYEILHRAGHAHSVEAWLPPDAGDARRAGAFDPERWRLVAGIFGVCVGRVFCAESKFHDTAVGASRDASKVVLVELALHLRRRGFDLIDTQLVNPHLEQFGCFEIEAGEYDSLLADSLRRPASW